jgi:hypothetical protein
MRWVGMTVIPFYKNNPHAGGLFSLPANSIAHFWNFGLWITFFAERIDSSFRPACRQAGQNDSVDSRLPTGQAGFRGNDNY